jgi:hypothetical protein
VLIGHELAYVLALGISSWLIVKKLSVDKRKLWLQILLLFFVVNLLLFIYWIFKVQLNPDINWEFQGNETEVDPWYIILYLPVLNFGLALLVTTLSYLFSLFTSKPIMIKKGTVL